MPKVALADTKGDWEQLLQAAQAYGELRNLNLHLAKLKAALDQVKELEALRTELQGQRQVVTQELNATRETGKVVAIEVRSLLKAILGSKSERLVQFRIRPRRSGYRRKRRPKNPESPTPTS